MKHLTHIISLPRCRTAWLSQALTHAPLCYGLHDGIADHREKRVMSPTEYAQSIRSLEAHFVTDCSSGIASSIGHLTAFGGPIIVVTPDSEEARRDSWIEHMNDPSLYDQWQVIAGNFQTCRQMLKERIVLTVPMAELNDHMPAIWSVCCPGVVYPERRIRDLARLNIQEIN